MKKYLFSALILFGFTTLFAQNTETEQKLLEQRELQNFRRTLQILINNDAFCKGMVKIVEE